MGRYISDQIGLKLPQVIGENGKILGVDDGVLRFIDTKSITRLQANPVSTTTTSKVGDVALNDYTGELFVCTYKSVSTGQVRWRGSFGTYVGYPVGQQAYYSATSTTFTIPNGVTSIGVVAVGGGGGGHYSWSNPAGGGGALAYVNFLPVTPGESLSIVVGAGGSVGGNGGNTYISRAGATLFTAQGGKYNATSLSNRAKPVSGTVIVSGGGAGGMCSANAYGGGGGAGGYGALRDGMDACGGDGLCGFPNMDGSVTYGVSGYGSPTYMGKGMNGAAAGGTGYNSSTYSFTGGGGVGLHGRGDSGIPRNGTGNSFYSPSDSDCSQGGSGGMGSHNNNSSATMYMVKPDGSTYGVTRYHGQGGLIGGGGAGGGTSVSSTSGFCYGGDGGLRIVWGREVDWTRSVPDLTVSTGVI